MASKPQEPLAIVFLGSIGVGKSYFSRQLAKEWEAVRLNADAFRLAMFGSLEGIKQHDGYGEEANKRLFGALEYSAKAILASNQTVIVDTARYNRSESRDKLSQVAKSVGAKLIVVWIETPREVASLRTQEREESEDQRRLDASRAEEILDDHYSKFQPPHPDELVIKIDGTVDFTIQYQSFEEQLKRLLKD